MLKNIVICLMYVLLRNCNIITVKNLYYCVFIVGVIPLYEFENEVLYRSIISLLYSIRRRLNIFEESQGL